MLSLQQMPTQTSEADASCSKCGDTAESNANAIKLKQQDLHKLSEAELDAIAAANAYTDG